MTIKEQLEVRKAWRDSYAVRLVLRVFPGSKLVKARGLPEDKKQEELWHEK